MRLRAASNDERLFVCYEAGYDGFWLARSSNLLDANESIFSVLRTGECRPLERQRKNFLAFAWREGVECDADGFPQNRNSACGCRPQQGLELGERHFDGLKSGE
jgi:hypothetical protein